MDKTKLTVRILNLLHTHHDHKTHPQDWVEPQPPPPTPAPKESVQSFLTSSLWWLIPHKYPNSCTCPHGSLLVPPLSNAMANSLIANHQLGHSAWAPEGSVGRSPQGVQLETIWFCIILGQIAVSCKILIPWNVVVIPGWLETHFGAQVIHSKV